ncbi:hypothetical protein [Streptomyces sp. NPDC059881]|uniref:hypothetical protein n=1 Tax=Streptomyces sp. NPDC059881 TaxID=3346986 RepID=UPI003669A3C0
MLGGPLHAGPLLDCMGAFTRVRRGKQDPRGFGLDPWWLRADHRPASARVQLRALAEQVAAARRAVADGTSRPDVGGLPTVRRLFRDRYGRAGAAYYRPGDGFDPGAGPAGQGDGRGRVLH